MLDLEITLQNLNSFRLQNQMTDVLLITEDGSKFAAHKAILYSGSKYFRFEFILYKYKLFYFLIYINKESCNYRKLFQEKPNAAVLKISGITTFVMSELLNFIYLNKFGAMTFECTQELYHGANSLKIKGACETCFEFLKEHINIKNCFNLYKFAK